MFFIIISCIVTALDNPLNDPESALHKTIVIIEMITIGVFIIE
jgi:hypothetical protein